MKHITSIIVLIAPLLLFGQETPLIYPGSPELDASVFKSFEAIYEQGGVEMSVRFHKSDGPEPIFTAFMIMPGPTDPSHMSVDVIGHYAKDLSFAYRKFGYGKFRNEYVHAEQKNDTLHVSRMDIASPDNRSSYIQLPVKEKFLDGTMAFWFLAGLPLKDGYGARFYRWDVGADSVTMTDTLPFIVNGPKKPLSLNGASYDCWSVEATLPNGMILRSYISKTAPYLISQEAIQPSGESFPLVQLKRIIE